MDVIYSMGARFAGGGIGDTSYYGVQGLYSHGLLKRLICGSFRPTEIPHTSIKSLGWVSRIFRRIASYDSKNRLDYIYRLFYDRWASHQLQSCQIFHGWDGYSLRSLQQARKMGSITVLDRPIAHPTYLTKLLQDDYSRWGVTYRPALTSQNVQKEIKTADYIFIPSDFVYHTFETENEDTSKLITIPYGVDTEKFHPLPRGASSQTTFRAIFVGQISIRKGAHYLLEAWKLLGWKDAELLLVGPNKLPSPIKMKYQNLSGVSYPGFVSNPVELFQQADVFVFPSLIEGSALVTYEAMACGLPVITTWNAGSVAEDEEQGLIIPAQNATAVAEALERIRTNETLRQQMSQAARQKAQGFTWKRYGDDVAHTLQMIYDKT